MHSRIRNSAVVLAFVAVLSGCRLVTQPFRAAEVRQQTAAHVPGTDLRVESRNGAIEIVADPEVTEVWITAEITAGGSTQEEADERLEQTELAIERGEDGALTVSAVFPQPHVNGDAAHFVVRLPDAARIEASSRNGAIAVSGFDAPSVLETANGAITVLSMTGDVRAKTSNGRITIEDVEGEIDVTTQNGAIVVTDAHGRVSAHSLNGAITVVLSDEATGPLDLRTSNGAITATVGAGFGGEVSLSTSNGTIVVDDAAESVRLSDIQRRRGTVHMSGDGEPSRLTTANGRIELKTRDG